MLQQKLEIYLNQDLQTSFTNLCADIGLNTSEAIEIMIQEAVFKKTITSLPQNIGINKETLEAIQEVEKMQKNPNLYKSYTSTDEMIKDLLK